MALQHVAQPGVGGRGRPCASAGLSPWTRRNFARWLFEDETPGRAGHPPTAGTASSSPAPGRRVLAAARFYRRRSPTLGADPVMGADWPAKCVISHP